EISIPKPRLWSTAKPDRYVTVTTIQQEGKLKLEIAPATVDLGAAEKDGLVVDSYSTPFGIRTIQFTPTNGFLLNGKRVQLYGVWHHHDLGSSGTAITMRARERQIEMLKEMAATPFAPAIIRPRPSCSNIATGWASW